METGAVPRWRKAWGQARELVRRGRFEEAAEGYRQVLAARESEGARWELARVLYRLRRYPEVGHLCGELIRTAPDNWEYRACQAAAAQAQGQYSRALTVLATIDEHPDVPPVPLLAAREELYRSLGDRGMSYATLFRYVSLVPDDLAAKRRLVLLADRLGRTSEVQGVLASLAEIDDPDILAIAAREEQRSGNGEQAAVFWRRYLAAGGGPLPAHLFFCRLLRRPLRSRRDPCPLALCRAAYTPAARRDGA